MIFLKGEMYFVRKSTHLEKSIFIQEWLTKNMWSIGKHICIFNNKFQNISLKKTFIRNNENDSNM
jgi:hypothetical protein